MTFGISQPTDGHNAPLPDFLTYDGLKWIGAVGPNGELRSLQPRAPIVDCLERVSDLPARDFSCSDAWATR
jgi:hypothetical protein